MVSDDSFAHWFGNKVVALGMLYCCMRDLM